MILRSRKNDQERLIDITDDLQDAVRVESEREDWQVFDFTASDDFNSETRREYCEVFSKNRKSSTTSIQRSWDHRIQRDEKNEEQISTRTNELRMQQKSRFFVEKNQASYSSDLSDCRHDEFFRFEMTTDWEFVQSLQRKRKENVFWKMKSADSIEHISEHQKHSSAKWCKEDDEDEERRKSKISHVWEQSIRIIRWIEKRHLFQLRTKEALCQWMLRTETHEKDEIFTHHDTSHFIKWSKEKRRTSVEMRFIRFNDNSDYDEKWRN